MRISLLRTERIREHIPARRQSSLQYRPQMRVFDASIYEISSVRP